MDIIIVGYGKMGKEVKETAISRGHKITNVFDDSVSLKQANSEPSVCIDFTDKDAFRENYKYIADKFSAAVVGTTGWNDIKDDVFDYFKLKGKTLIYANNFSIGVNLFFQIIESSSTLLKNFGSYDPYILEMHHNQKKDMPSGTAIEIENILKRVFGKDFRTAAIRSGQIKGFHQVGFESEVDKIVINHENYSRKGFAEGAVLAAEWAKEVKGIWSFKDLLKSKSKFTGEKIITTTAIQGCGTALITPFNKEQEVDYDVFRKLVKRQIDAGIHFLVPLGTTGEAACLEDREKVKVLEIAVSEARGKIPVVAGVGSNNTKHVLNNIKLFEPLGVDAFLVVTPYYNKPTQSGLYNHFKTIADSTDKPIVMYNVPSRTGTNITAETCLKLAEIKNIVAVKEASSNYAQISTIIKNAPKDFSVLSGNDNETLPLIATGARGVISVASNIVPKEMAVFSNLLLDGNFEEARQLYYKLMKLFENCFIETNPIPVKAGMYKIGLIENVLRPPLYSGTDHTLRIMQETMNDFL